MRRSSVILVAAIVATFLGAPAAPVQGAPAAPSFRAVAAGFENTCAITTGGILLCWGRNDFGQLGDGSTFDRHTPVEVVGLATPTWAVAMGRNHTCALSVGGGVSCWGDNAHGQLGDGSTKASVLPVNVVGLASGVAAIAAGDEHTCALMAAGNVRCWGANVNGAVGDRTRTDRTTPVGVVDLAAGATAISAGGFGACAVLSNGRVKCWGVTGQAPTDVSGLGGDVVAIGAGHQHTCAVIRGGAVMCWGLNAFGALGDGTTTSSEVPVPVVGLTGASGVEGGYVHSCALTLAGGVVCWGDNRFAQLGDGTTSANSTTPVPVYGLASGVQAIAVGDMHTCALTVAGAVTCWGRNDFGGLGDGTRGTRNKPAGLVMIVPQAVVLRASKPSGSDVAAGQVVIFRGVARPYPTTERLWGVQFVVFRWTGDHWKYILVRTVHVADPYGRASLSWSFTTPGSYEVRARVVAQPGYADSAWSPFLTYTVH